MSFTGLSFNDGVGLGHVVLHEPRIVVTNLFNEDSEQEMRRLETALGSLRLSIDDMLSRRDVAFEGEHRDVLEAYRMFANDRGWVRRLDEAIRNGLTAEAAVEKVQSDMRARMLHMTDPYLRERMNDFDDLANRLLRQLMGRGPEMLAERRCPRTPSSSPAPWARPNCSTIRATSCAAWCWRTARRPATSSSSRAPWAFPSSARSRAPSRCRRTATPSSSTARTARSICGRSPTSRRPMPKRCASGRGGRSTTGSCAASRPATRDGVAVTLLMNAGLVVDLPQLAESGAAGIGLFRTELQFMIASTFPRAEAQEQLYRDVLDAARGKPVTFRTIDIGGDKVLPYFKNATTEENPALGWRAIRLTLDRPGLLRTQIRALLKAAGGRELRIMLPMVTELGEIAQAREIIDREVRHLSRFAPSAADQPEARRHARGAVAAVAARRADGRGRFRLGRLQRPVPVRDGHRPRQHAACRPLRPAVGAVPARPQADRRRRRAQPERR